MPRKTCASLLVVLATRALRSEAMPRYAPNLGLGAAGLGLCVVAIKAFEYHEKITAGITPNTNQFYMYYFVRGGLGLTVTVGVTDGTDRGPKARKIQCLTGSHACVLRPASDWWIASPIGWPWRERSAADWRLADSSLVGWRAFPAGDRVGVDDECDIDARPGDQLDVHPHRYRTGPGHQF